MSAAGYLMAELGQEWTDLDERARQAVIADFRDLVRNPEHFGYDGAVAFPELAREYHRSIGQGHLAAYAAVLANSGPLYGRADTSQFEMHGRAFLCDLAEADIEDTLRDDPGWMTEHPEAYQVRNYANILADGLLPECGHAVKYADLYQPQVEDEDFDMYHRNGYHLPGQPSGPVWVCTHESHPRPQVLYLTPWLGGRAYPGPLPYCAPDAKPLLSIMVNAGMESLAREHLQALAERRISEELTRLHDDPSALGESIVRARQAKIYRHYADILADGILPECGHPVHWAQRHGDRGWVCGCFVVGDAEELYPPLDITLALFR